MSMITVAYNKLVLSEKQQARQSGVTPESLKPLAANIKAIGLLQNMVVIKSRKRGHYEVVAGGRRWAAIGMLVKEGHFTPDQAFEVKLVRDDQGLLASLAENLHHVPMNAADEFEAFARLIDQGLSIEDVAATFNEDEKLIRQRLKLAKVAPELIAAFRAGELKLAALMAFTLANDQERQLTVWRGLSEWQRDNPHVIRNALTESKISASNRIVRFVGLQTYQDAGGAVMQDLFAEGENGIYIEQPQMLHDLALAKLRQQADAMQREGWAWADVALEVGHDELRKFGRVHPTPRKLTADEQSRLDAFQRRYDKLTEQMQALEEASDDDDDDQYLTLDTQRDDIADQMQQVQDATLEFSAESKAMAGVVLAVDIDGDVTIHAGLIRPQDRQKVAQAQADQPNTDARIQMPMPNTRPAHSERLVRQLSANKTGIVAASLLEHPHGALAILAAHLGDQVLGGGYGLGFDAVKISLARNDFKLTAAAPDFEGSLAHGELAAHRRHWLDELPKDDDGDLLPILPWALEQDTATLIEFLAFCVANSLDGVQHQEHTNAISLDAIARVIQLDVARWWAPTAASYLSMVKLGRIVEVVTEACGATDAAPLVKLKKGQAVTEAEKLLAGKGWMPEILRVKVPPIADESHEQTRPPEYAEAE